MLLAGGAGCLLVGYFVGYLAAPDAPDRTTASVVSFDTSTARLCLGGDAVKDQTGVDKEGHLCGLWRRSQSSPAPQKGDKFRFVSVRTASSTGKGSQILIYGSVVS